MHKGRRAVVALACLAIVAVGCAEQTPTAEESQLAEQLQSELASQGLDVGTETLIALFGDDGGHLCIDAEQGSDFTDVVLVSHRFALRKTTVDSEDVMVASAVIDVYCPDERAAFDEFVASLDVEVKQ